VTAKTLQETPKRFIRLTMAVSAVLSAFHGLRAEEPPARDEAELAKKLNNPIASLISVPFQSNEDFHIGPTGNGCRYTLNIQPVVPVSIGPDWNVIVRTILPYVSQHDVFDENIPSFPGLPDKILNGLPPAQRAGLGRLPDVYPALSNTETYAK
jgi:hypothetical protein